MGQFIRCKRNANVSPKAPKHSQLSCRFRLGFPPARISARLQIAICRPFISMRRYPFLPMELLQKLLLLLPPEFSSNEFGYDGSPVASYLHYGRIVRTTHGQMIQLQIPVSHKIAQKEVRGKSFYSRAAADARVPVGTSSLVQTALRAALYSKVRLENFEYFNA